MGTMSQMEITVIARVVHQVNLAYCRAFGDETNFEWDEAPDWQKESACRGVEFFMQNPEAGPDAGHRAWLEEHEADGWQWGPDLDEESKTHPCFVPFEELPPAQRAKDVVFRAVVIEMLKIMPSRGSGLILPFGRH